MHVEKEGRKEGDGLGTCVHSLSRRPHPALSRAQTALLRPINRLGIWNYSCYRAIPLRRRGRGANCQRSETASNAALDGACSFSRDRESDVST